MVAATPKGLGVTGRKLWRETVTAFELRQDELESLRAACMEADLIDRMESELSGADLTVFGSTGQLVAHPLVSELRQHRMTMAGLLRGLKLPDGDEGLAGNQHRAAAQSRWAQSRGKTA